MLIVPLIFVSICQEKKKITIMMDGLPAIPSLSSITITRMNGRIKDFLALPSELSYPPKRLRLDILILLM